MRNLPERILVDGGMPLAQLMQALTNTEIPTVDPDALLDHLVECLLHYPTADYELAAFPHLFMENYHFHTEIEIEDGIVPAYNSASKASVQMQQIALLAQKLGFSLKTTFKVFKLFSEDTLQYEHDRILDDRSLLLRVR